MINHSSYQKYFQQTVIRSLNLSCNLINTQPFSDDLRDDGLAALDIALKPQITTLVWQQTKALLLALSPRMERSGYWHSWQLYLSRGLEISKTLLDKQSIAAISLQIGVFCQRQGKFSSANHWYAVSIGHAQEVNEVGIWINALNRSGLIASTQHKIDEASTYVQQAFQLMSDDDPQREFSYYVMGNIALKLSEYENAAVYFQHSLDICEQSHDTHQIACRLKDLGVALHYQGAYQKALNVYERALKHLQEVNDPVELAITKMNQGVIYECLDEPEKSLLYYAEAKPILEKAQNKVNLAKLYNNQGYCYYRLQRWREAKKVYQASLVLWQQLDSQVDYANVLDGLGLVYHQQGYLEKAVTTFEDALRTLSEITERHAIIDLSQEITEYLQATRSELA